MRYYFNITGYQNYKKFYDDINFASIKKSKELKKLVNSIENKKSFRLRHNETKNAILSMFKKDNILTNNEIRERLSRQFPHIKWHENTIGKHLNQLERKNILSVNHDHYPYYWKLA